MVKHPDNAQFIRAAETEFQGLQDRAAWEVIDITDVPEGSKIFPMRWVFVNNRDGDLVKHKARIVVRDDLDETPYLRDEIYSHTLGLQGGLFSTPVSGVPYDPPALTVESKEPRLSNTLSTLS